MSMLLPADVTVCEHPLAAHSLALLRNRETPSELFRSAMARLGRIVLLTATQDLPLANKTIQTPICATQVQQIPSEIPIIVAPILRAGLTLSEVALELMPMAKVYHIGLYRDEETLKPVTYYNKLPPHLNYAIARVFLMDPMLATGGSASAAVTMMRDLGVPLENIRFVSIIAAQAGLQMLSAHHPGIRIFTAAVDEKLNDKAYIVPGLGDAGDRTFATD